MTVSEEDLRFDRLAREFFEMMLKRDPIFATEIGIHKYDDLMPDVSRKGILKDIRLCENYLKMFSRIKDADLSFDRLIDKHLAIINLKYFLFSGRVLRQWEKDPDVAGLIGDAIFPLYTRKFSPFSERLDSIISRLRESIHTYEQAKETITKPVALWTNMAIESCSSLPAFINEVVNLAQKKGRRSQVVELSRVVKELKYINQEYICWLRKLLPSANQSFMIGRDNLEKLLDIREIGLDADEIYSLAENTLKKERQVLANIVLKIKKEATIKQINERIHSDHPHSFKKVLELYKKEIDDAKSFIVKKQLMTIPKDCQLIVSKTPQYERHILPYAAYNPPSRFDNCKQGVYVITPPKDASELRRHNYTLIPCTTIHEIYPGHHLQASCANTNPSLIRSIFDTEEFTEGWAFYCEEYMLEKGYKDTLQRRFIVTINKIWRAARAIIDIDMQSGKMSFDDAVKFLMNETQMDKSVCESEVKWYTRAPGEPLSYLVGKYQILQLKEKVKKMAGKSYNEKLFHDTLLYSGSMPLKYYLPIFERQLRTVRSRRQQVTFSPL